jgi:hypothetical protein
VNIVAMPATGSLAVGMPRASAAAGTATTDIWHFQSILEMGFDIASSKSVAEIVAATFSFFGGCYCYLTAIRLWLHNERLGTH